MTTEELLPIVKGIYSLLKEETESPNDGAQVILMLHVLLWLNCKDDTNSTEEMLKSYCSDFQKNFDRNWKANLNG